MTDRPIFVHLPNWIGDAAMAVPALRALDAARPGARWILAGHPRSIALFGRWPSDLLLAAGGGSGEGTMGLARKLRSFGCEEALILPTSLRAALAPFLAGIPRRVAFGSDGRAALLTDPVRPPGREGHLARQFVELAARLGADPLAPLDPRLPVGEDEIALQRERLKDKGMGGGPCVAFCPGATYGETKRWPLPHWVALGRIMRGRGYTVLVLGGKDEISIGAQLAAEDPNGMHNLAGELTLRESLAMLHLVQGTVSNDSGAMHLAAAAGCPVVGLFGSTNPAWTGPLGPRSRALSLALSCSPCYSRSCPTQIECLRDMKPERVAGELLELIATDHGGARP